MSDIFIDRDWFKVWPSNGLSTHYPQLSRGDGISTVLSMYSPHFLDDSEGEDNGPYTSGLTFGLFNDRNDKPNIILFSMFPRQQLDPNQLIIHSRNLCLDYFNNSAVRTFEGGSPDVLVVPSIAGARNCLFKEIASKNGGVPVKRFYYNNYGKTLDNMLNRALPKIIQGKVWVASKPDNRYELRNLDERFLHILSGYPHEETRGTAWALAQAILFLDTGGAFRDSHEAGSGVTKPKHWFYGV